ncbi:serine protease 23 [Arapaima gigas]
MSCSLTVKQLFPPSHAAKICPNHCFIFPDAPPAPCPAQRTVRIPLLVLHDQRRLSHPHFSAHPQLDLTTYCNATCYWQGDGELDVNLPTERLAFETLYSDGSRTLTTVGVKGEKKHGDTSPPTQLSARRKRAARHRRRRRQIYGEDGRFSIPGDHFLLEYPFSTAVLISTGCSGVLVSSRHVLTAAHCVHNGKDYVKGSQKLRVGFLSPPDRNSTRPGQSSPARPLVHWVRVRRLRVPKGWIQSPPEIRMDFDYTLLELRRPHRRPFMRLSVAPSFEDLAGKRIHFSGFDSDRPGELVYRFCPVEDESNELIYQHCDARPGASGSGVYGRVWDSALERWDRKVFGVFSGHQWLEVDGQNYDFNVAVRLTPLKIAQICYWLHGSHVSCNQDLE